MPDSTSNPLATWFNGIDYDFICIQEVFTTGRFEILKNALTANNYIVIKPTESSNIFCSGLVIGIKNSSWNVISDSFTPYKDATGVELFANKGFHCIEVVHKTTGLPLLVINTHMQSENPSNYFGGCIEAGHIRKAQSQQIYDYLLQYKPIRHLLIGDLNSDLEAHDEISYLTGAVAGIRKHTYPSTGEDLDHVAVLPKFWNGFLIPVVKNVKVLTKLTWSDHWAIYVELLLKG